MRLRPGSGEVTRQAKPGHMTGRVRHNLRPATYLPFTCKYIHTWLLISLHLALSLSARLKVGGSFTQTSQHSGHSGAIMAPSVRIPDGQRHVRMQPQGYKDGRQHLEPQTGIEHGSISTLFTRMYCIRGGRTSFRNNHMIILHSSLHTYILFAGGKFC